MIKKFSVVAILLLASTIFCSSVAFATEIAPDLNSIAIIPEYTICSQSFAVNTAVCTITGIPYSHDVAVANQYCWGPAADYYHVNEQTLIAKIIEVVRAQCPATK